MYIHTEIPHSQSTRVLYAITNTHIYPETQEHIKQSWTVKKQTLMCINLLFSLV